MTDPVIFEQRVASDLDDVEERNFGSVNSNSGDWGLVDVVAFFAVLFTLTIMSPGSGAI